MPTARKSPTPPPPPTTRTYVCRGCRHPVTPGFYWHPQCLSAYRAGGDYRRRALARDGYACAKCLRLRNAALLADASTGRLRTWAFVHAWAMAIIVLAAQRKWTTPTRKRVVQVDHIDPIGGPTGTHDDSNLQVLCVRHHAAKTVVDLARMKGRSRTRSVGRGTALKALVAVLGVVALLRLLPDPQVTATFAAAPGAFAGQVLASYGPAVGLGLVLGGAGWCWRGYRRGILRRLHESLTPITGDSNGARRRIKVHRWGRIGARLVPVDFTLRYPHTFTDANADSQSKVEDQVRAKLGYSSMTAEWNRPGDRVRIAYPDPFVTMAPVTWPWAGGGQRSVWDPIPVGFDAHSRPVTISLIGKNLLIGGEPEAGKSVAQAQIIAAAALDPDCTLMLADGKLVEQAIWRDVAEAYVSTTADLIALLADVVMQIELRYEVLASQGRTKVERGDGLGTIMVAIDELAFFTADPNKALREQVQGLLRDVISRGRACGVIVVAATQRPSHDVVPTMIRDLIGLRWAMRISTASSSDMILGGNKAAEGFSSHKIDMAARGCGFLFAEGTTPTLVRSYFLTREELVHLAGAASRVRGRVSLVKGPRAS